MRRSALLVICLAVFVDMLGFGIILPLLPFHAEALGGAGVWVGAVLTAYSAAQFFSAPLLGSLSDRFGRRPLLLASLAGSAVSLALTGIATTLVTLLAARLVAGLFGGAISVGQAYVVDLSEPSERTKALGMVGASIGMGFVFGPAIGAGLSGLGFAGVSFVASGIALANLIAGLFLLPRGAAGAFPRDASGALPGDGAEVGAMPLRSANPLAPLAKALRMPGLATLLAIVFVATMAFAGMEATYALLGERLYGLGPAGLGLVFTAIGVIIAIVQGGLVGRLAHRFGERSIAIVGALLMAAGLVVIPLGSAWLNYLFLAVLAVGQALLTTSTAALISQAGVGAVGGAFGAGQSAAAAARAIGPLLAGAAFDVRAALPYLAGAVLCLLAAFLLQRPQARVAQAPAVQTSSGK
jgi:DHA1 family tetracycline resistance protein-like MFS transporter